MIGAGRRNKRITIERLTQTTTAGGEVTETPVTVAHVWAAVEPLSSAEAWKAKQSQTEVTHKITMLYRADITAAMRAKYGSRVFNFGSVLNVDEANRELVITAIEITA